MILVQMTGLSGSGKTTIAEATKGVLIKLGYKVELIDGDEYRKNLSHDLGFSKADRIENIRRLGFVGLTLAKHGVISIMAVINPYEIARENLRQQSSLVKTVFVDCPLNVVIDRDVKGLYKKALLPEGDKNRINHFTGISDPFEKPEVVDLVLDTNTDSISESVNKFVSYILQNAISSKHTMSYVNVRTQPKALFIGRWQPFHNGHKWLIDNKLKENIPVLIAVRDMPVDDQNPFTTEQTIDMIRTVYANHHNVDVIRIDDIESFNYGRGVGYQINEFVPPISIANISATSIRNDISVGNDSWKASVDSKIYKLIKL
jgi:adenylylsulfate kinase